LLPAIQSGFDEGKDMIVTEMGEEQFLVGLNARVGVWRMLSLCAMKEKTLAVHSEKLDEMK
jgi:hypothetical protein